MTDVVITETHPADDEDQERGGIGVVSGGGASVRLERFVMSRSALCGLEIVGQG